MTNWLKDKTFPFRRAVYSMLGRLPIAGKTITKDFTVLGTSPNVWPVVTQLIDSTSVVYSVGVGDDISFDLQLHQENNCEIHLFDPTPVACAYAERLSLPAKIVHHKIGVACHDGSLHFNRSGDSSACYRASNRNKWECELPANRISTIMKNLNHAKIDLLKLDIEGCEYETLEDIFSEKIFPAQILVEFHHRFTPEHSVSKTNQMVRKLNSHGYRCFFTSKYRQEYGFLSIV